MANTLKKIQTVTVGSGGAATIEFTSIPQTYTDLKIVLSVRTTASGTAGTNSLSFQINGVTTNRTNKVLYGTGSAAGSFSPTSAYGGAMASAGVTASIFSSHEIYIPNYTSANNKSYSVDSVSENNATDGEQDLGAGLWSQTAAITSLTFLPSNGSFVQYSTATLYGVSNVNLGSITSSPYATGGTVTSNGQYYIHTFTSDGTFTPNQSLNVEYLVVAGGGGGGAASGGGGGGGGLRCTSAATGGGGSLESQLSLTATAYTVTVGAGGAAAVSGTSAAGAGSNSVFSTITSTGGGRGASATDGHAATTGGSGGGGATRKGASGEDLHQNTGGSGTSNQGYAGGTTTSATVNGTARGAGGGGAAGVGATGSANSTGGNGGSGVTVFISGSIASYAGGGGGGSQGGTAGTATAGGGNGSNSSVGAGSNGTSNTGGGGGGGGVGDASRNGGAGGSGIVIVRYTV